MKHLILIDDKTSAGKAIFEVARQFAKTDKKVLVDRKAISLIEEVEDELLISEMKKSEKHGIAGVKEKENFVKKVKRMAK